MSNEPRTGGRDEISIEIHSTLIAEPRATSTIFAIGQRLDGGAMRELQPLDQEALLSTQERAIGEPEAFGDNEPTQPDRPWPGDGIATFYRALCSVQARANDLTDALAAAYPLDMEIAASNLVSACLAMAGSLRMLRQRTADARAQERAALTALGASRQALTQLFHRCLTPPSPASELPRLRDILGRLGWRIEQMFEAVLDPYM